MWNLEKKLKRHSNRWELIGRDRKGIREGNGEVNACMKMSP
jgi:hypothetical protein